MSGQLNILPCILAVCLCPRRRTYSRCYPILETVRVLLDSSYFQTLPCHKTTKHQKVIITHNHITAYKSQQEVWGQGPACIYDIQLFTRRRIPTASPLDRNTQPVAPLSNFIIFFFDRPLSYFDYRFRLRIFFGDKFYLRNLPDSKSGTADFCKSWERNPLVCYVCFVARMWLACSRAGGLWDSAGEPAISVR